MSDLCWINWAFETVQAQVLACIAGDHAAKWYSFGEHVHQPAWVEELLEQVRLDPAIARRYPLQLFSGQRNVNALPSPGQSPPVRA